MRLGPDPGEEGGCWLGVEHLLGSSPDCRESKLRHLVPG